MKRTKRSDKLVLVTVSATVIGDDGVPGPPLEDEDDRGNWSNQCEFILSCLGFAVGFGNVWRFPYLCYKNGGAVFLIPYFTMLVCAGLPMFFMELSLGQYVGFGPNMLFPNIAPIFSGLGMAMPLVSFYVSIYFDVIIAWSLYYMFSSFVEELPWANCDHDFNSPGCATVDEVRSCQNTSNNNISEYLFYYNKACLNISDICAVNGYEPYNATHCSPANSSDILSSAQAVKRMSSSEDFYKNGVLGVQDTTFEHMGSMQWKLVGCLALGWVIVGAGLAKGVKSSGKAVYFTALFPYVVLTVLLGIGLTLDGAQDGIDFYFLQPNMTKLGEMEVWTDAASQIFFSLGSSFGSLITLASYNKFTTNCMRDSLIIASCNCLTSVYAGFVLFSILGSLAKDLGVPVSEVVSSGSGLAFIAYPQAVLNMPPPQLWSVLFFCMFITLGLSSQFAMVETVNTAIYDQWPSLRKKKHFVVLGVCSVMFLFGLPMCLQGGVFLFELLNLYSAGLCVIILAITEVIVVQYIYGHTRFMHNIEKEIGIWIPLPLKFYWKITWLFVTPVSLLLVFVMSILYWVPAYWGDYLLPDSAQTLGWLIAFSSISLVVLTAIFVLIKGEHRGKDLVRPTKLFCPPHERRKRNFAKQILVSSDRFSYTNTTLRGPSGDTKERPSIDDIISEDVQNKKLTSL